MVSANTRFLSSDLLNVDHSESAVTSQTLDFITTLHEETVSHYFVSAGTSCFFIYDFSKDCILSAGGKVNKLTGYSEEDFKGISTERFINNIHPDDRVVLKQLILLAQKHCQLLSADRYLKTWRNYTFRFKKADGNYFHMLRQDIVLRVNDSGSPTYGIWFGTDISHIKSDNRVIATITDEDGEQKIISNISGLPLEHKPLSMREREIICLVAQGLSSKQIADRLHLSFHTITTHKRNIFEKTSSPNANALVKFAMREGII